MQIQVNTDSSIQGSEGLTTYVSEVVSRILGRFNDRITRVEVHLADENKGKPGPDDQRCMMEVRLAGHQPTTATHHAATLHQAVDGAADKLKRAIEHLLGRIEDKQRR